MPAEKYNDTETSLEQSLLAALLGVGFKTWIRNCSFHSAAQEVTLLLDSSACAYIRECKFHLSVSRGKSMNPNILDG